MPKSTTWIVLGTLLTTAAQAQQPVDGLPTWQLDTGG